MNIRSIFISPAEPRLRAGWRLLIQSVLWNFLIALVFVPAAFIPQVMETAGLLYLQIAAFIGTTLSVFLARRFLDKRSFISLGIGMSRQALMDVLAGIVIPFFMMGLIFAIEWAAGWMTVDSFAWQIESLPSLTVKVLVALITFVLVGWNEELLSRGYHLQTLESGLNTFWAVLLSSAIFGILHVNNPNVESVVFTFTGIFLAGVFLAYGYLRTRQLWLPIGLHIGWNFFEGVLFGFPVSGLDTYHLMRIRLHGPELWTGGPFGPEAGLVLVPGLILGFILVYIYTRGHNNRELGDSMLIKDTPKKPGQHSL